MDQTDQEMVTAKLKEIHRLIDETFGLRGGLAAVIVLDEGTANIYGVDCMDPNAARSFLPVFAEEEFGTRLSRVADPVKHWQLTIRNRSRELASGTVMMGCAVRPVEGTT